MYVVTHINNDISLKTKVLKKPQQIIKGMMGKKFTNEFFALLFVMGTPKSSFWMKNCIVPLDVVFIKNGIIAKIYHNCPPCTGDVCKSYPGEGELVMELPGGSCKDLKIKRGNKVFFTK
jgi:uncharacterized membrane protein (UPF0127 family)